MRRTIGSVIKGKKRDDGTTAPDYIKLKSDVTLKAGEFLNLESKQQQEKGIQDALAAGRMTAEQAEKQLGYISKIPDFVRFDIVRNEK